MTYAQICEAVAKLQRKYGESDPFKLCEDMGILLNSLPMGGEQNSIKGFFVENSRIRAITVNSDLPLVIQRIIVAHELGHAELHRHCGVCAFHDVGLFDNSSVYEKEANLFAAEYLMPDEDVLSILNADYTFFTAASQLNVPMELLDFKFRVMKWKGYKLVEPPIQSTSTFLRDIEIPDAEPDCD